MAMQEVLRGNPKTLYQNHILIKKLWLKMPPKKGLMFSIMDRFIDQFIDQNIDHSEKCHKKSPTRFVRL